MDSPDLFESFVRKARVFKDICKKHLVQVFILPAVAAALGMAVGLLINGVDWRQVL